MIDTLSFKKNMSSLTKLTLDKNSVLNHFERSD